VNFDYFTASATPFVTKLCQVGPNIRLWPTFNTSCIRLPDFSKCGQCTVELCLL